MNLADADRMVDIAANALARTSGGVVGRRSWLRGVDEEKLVAALMLRLARTYLHEKTLPDGRSLFAFTVECATGIHMALLSNFAEDHEVDEIEKMPSDSRECILRRAKLMTRHLDTPAEAEAFERGQAIGRFSEFCETLDREDPLFWQKVFTAIGLPFDPKTFRG